MCTFHFCNIIYSVYNLGFFCVSLSLIKYYTHVDLDILFEDSEHLIFSALLILDTHCWLHTIPLHSPLPKYFVKLITEYSADFQHKNN